MKKIILALSILIGCSNPFFSFADIRLPAIISSHMVLQQHSAVKIWGWASPGEKILLSTNWDTTTVTTVADGNAKWTAVLQTPKAGGSYTVTLKGYNSLVLDDVLIGEVWGCSGQSNMEMNINWGVKEYPTEIENATNKQIRFFNITRLTAADPQDDTKGNWMVCTPTDMKSFSLAGYFFGQRLQQVLQVPVGLINASWGGTPAETWTPKDIIEKDTILKNAAAQLKPSTGWPTAAGLAYNAMVSPITNYNIAGIIWYQGESNVGTSATYTALFTSMINGWRKNFKKDLPFYFVQVAPFSGYGGISGALLREAQTKTLALPNTGMVVTQDLVTDVTDIHPHNKKDVGLRLANYALAETYGQKQLNYKSPMYKKMFVEKDKIRIEFDNADSGLTTKHGTATEFFIAGEDKVFTAAKAVIKGNTVLVSNKNIKHPVAVRFGFTSAAMPDLFSKEGLPVNSFRTDDWK